MSLEERKTLVEHRMAPAQQGHRSTIKAIGKTQDFKAPLQDTLEAAEFLPLLQFVTIASSPSAPHPGEEPGCIPPEIAIFHCLTGC